MQTIAPPNLLSRILVGVDSSPESVEAAHRAAALLAPGGTLTLLSAWRVPPPVVVNGIGPALSDEHDLAVYRSVAENAVDAAVRALEPFAPSATLLARGLAWDALIEAAQEVDATLIAVGSHGQGRVQGIVLGSTATELVHKAPCSVLLARGTGASPPRRIAVGVDGSDESAAAAAVARELADRFEAELRPVVAHGGTRVDRAAVEAIAGRRREDLPDEPVPALVAASAEADLLVVGSRGLHGLKALGSVSERVAHQARCSTLVVRTSPRADR